MTRRKYVLDTEDKRLVDDARHAVAGGSLRQLARMLERSEQYLRHILSGRASGLDPASRRQLQHLIVQWEVTDNLIEGSGDRWAVRAGSVLNHLLTCVPCLTNAIIASDRHFRDSVARGQPTD